MKNLTIFASLLCLSALSTNVIAHTEKDKARFVAEQGQDTGKCDNVLRPCKTIAYAVKHASKGDKVLVSSGIYVINSEDELFYFKSGLIPIKGGYNRFDHFQSQSPQINVATLVGVPTAMRAEIESMGFNVAVDGKYALDNKQLEVKLANHNQMKESHGSEQCVDNLADAFSCKNVDLHAHMSLSAFSSNPAEANDIWGHVDLNTGDEYAIIGLNNGVSVVNITDPENPTEVGSISGVSSTWRDIKVYQYFDETLNLWRAYAYATVDRGNQHVTIINLNHLPNSISLAENNTSVTKAHNVYISNVDHSLNIAQANATPSLQLVGSNKYGGGFHSYSLENPDTLTFTSPLSAGDGYTHDGTSLILKDSRKNEICGADTSLCTVFIDFQGKIPTNDRDVIKLWNVSNPSDAKLISSATYNDIAVGDQYIHSGWATEDNNFFFAHDEFDEGYAGLNTTIRIFSIEDLKNPAQIGTWTGPTSSIDHNGFVRGNRYYMSTYMSGLTILDITDPANPVTAGSFDTYTSGDYASYNGAWGVYPYLPSGNILVSDISGGLFILKDNTLDSPQGSLSFNQAELSTEQDTNLQIDVHRNMPADSATTVSVSYEILPGSAKIDEDYTPVSGTLTWSGNSAGIQSFTIPIVKETTETEYQESFFVRLYDPRNGATLTSPSYLKVNLAGEIDSGKVGFTVADITVPENQETVNIEVARDGNSAGEVSVNYNLSGVTAALDSDIESSAGTLTWADGNSDNQTITLTIINDDEEEVNETAELVLTSSSTSTLGTNNTITITITDDDANNAPIVSIGENREVNTGQSVTLTATATDAESDDITYSWQQLNATSIAFDKTDQQTVTFVAPSSATTLEIEVTATDVKGASSTSSITITVVAPTDVITVKKSSGGGGGSFGFSLIALLALLRLRSTKA